mmetsp:Transcript_93481/g.250446  ORF Transcript_93481/g.250446 Transcript_93481/m.250446 type:complete len:371 (+) Transcript_93481:551-1663(+)
MRVQGIHQLANVIPPHPTHEQIGIAGVISVGVGCTDGMAQRHPLHPVCGIDQRTVPQKINWGFSTEFPLPPEMISKASKCCVLREANLHKLLENSMQITDRHSLRMVALLARKFHQLLALGSAQRPLDTHVKLHLCVTDAALASGSRCKLLGRACSFFQVTSGTEIKVTQATPAHRVANGNHCTALITAMGELLVDLKDQLDLDLASALRNLRSTHVRPGHKKVMEFFEANPVIRRLQAIFPLNSNPACHRAWTLHDSNSTAILQTPLPIGSSDHSNASMGEACGKGLGASASLAQDSDQLTETADNLEVMFTLMSNSVRSTFSTEIPENCCPIIVDVNDNALCTFLLFPGRQVRSAADAYSAKGERLIH